MPQRRGVGPLPGRVPQLVGHRAVDAGRAASRRPRREVLLHAALGRVGRRAARRRAAARRDRGDGVADPPVPVADGRRLATAALRPQGRAVGRERAGDAHGRAHAARRRGPPRGGLRRAAALDGRRVGRRLARRRLRHRRARLRRDLHLDGRLLRRARRAARVPARAAARRRKRRREGGPAGADGARRAAVLPRPLRAREPPAPVPTPDGALRRRHVARGGAPVPADGARVRLVEAPHGRRHARGHDDGAAHLPPERRARRAVRARAAPAGRARLHGAPALRPRVRDAGGGALGAAAAPAPARALLRARVVRRRELRGGRDAAAAAGHVAVGALDGLLRPRRRDRQRPLVLRLRVPRRAGDVPVRRGPRRGGGRRAPPPARGRRQGRGGRGRALTLPQWVEKVLVIVVTVTSCRSCRGRSTS